MSKERHIINDDQRRAVAITLALLDATLCQLEQWGKGRQARSVLYKEENLLLPAQRRHLLREIAGMRTVLEELQDVLRLPGQLQTATDDIWSRCAECRESLMELEGGKLRGYGEVSHGLRRLLDENIPLLLQRLDRITSAASDGEPPRKNSQ